MNLESFSTSRIFGFKGFSVDQPLKSAIKFMENIALSDDDRRIIRLPVNVYESISEFIVERLKQGREISLHRLLDEALSTTSIQFVGDPAWCFLQVKRDLEARGVIRVKIQRRPKPIQSISLGRKRRQSLEEFS